MAATTMQGAVVNVFVSARGLCLRRLCLIAIFPIGMNGHASTAFFPIGKSVSR